MPTYQYACTDTDCGARFELVQTFTEPAASECPVCKHAVRKVYGSVGVVFKGSGFYRNDSRKASHSSESAGSSDSASGSKSDSKSESTSGSKSDSKSESTSGSKSDSKSGSYSRSGSKEPVKSAAAASA